MRYEADVISKNIKRKQKINRILFILLYILLIPTILFSLFLIIIELGNSKEGPSFFNIELYTVISESMSPRLNINDIVIVKKGYEIESYKKGNIITFIRDNEVITHRIERVISADMRPAFITKGDNNKVEDEEIVKYENIIGKVVLTMPKIGALVNLLKNKLFFVSILCLLFGIMYFDNKSKKRRQERKLVREKYEKKSDFYF